MAKFVWISVCPVQKYWKAQRQNVFYVTLIHCNIAGIFKFHTIPKWQLSYWHQVNFFWRCVIACSHWLVKADRAKRSIVRAHFAKSNENASSCKGRSLAASWNIHKHHSTNQIWSQTTMSNSFSIARQGKITRKNSSVTGSYCRQVYCERFGAHLYSEVQHSVAYLQKSNRKRLIFSHLLGFIFFATKGGECCILSYGSFLFRICYCNIGPPPSLC